ncbi:hypothetical protein BBJ29_002167 [Phytophthora kernoviae]|uniref:Uncharacterized protein n=1 Tax=Phytophthora kernoviae TaxID=325452 RepID=A0A3F2S3M5_9STRA|nr:hypothetical protein BBJ29_002167 [Phytophthora kernoviae]RLN69698.1 hypothetical protein BBP00_00000171 [Phytophthora kernoviae]
MSARRLREAIKTTPRNAVDTPRKPIEDEHDYLRRCVDPVLMPLIESLLLYQPESVYHFIHDFVDEQKASRFAYRPQNVGYAKKLANRRNMADFMSTSVIPVMDDLAKQILREKPSSVKGFTSATFETETGSATFYDLGGGPTFRNVWREYYADAHGVIFVVDSSSENSVIQAASVLEESMANELMANKPLLIFANKRDHCDAVPEQEMQNFLRLQKYPSSKLVPCVSKPAVNDGAVDDRLEMGLTWLFDQVHHQFDALHERVQNDLALKKILDQQRREEQRARVSRWREEREIGQMRAHDKPSTEEQNNPQASAKTAADPEDPVIYCSNCSTQPAVTKCSASKWMPVCEACATALRNQS